MNRRDQFYAWLGFHECRAPMPPDRDGFLPGCGSSRMIFDVSWRDRLRLLVSGRIMVDLAHQMDRMPRRWETTGAYSILPPEIKNG